MNYQLIAVACLRLRTYLHLNGCFFIGVKMDNKQKLKQLKRSKHKSERSQKYNFPDDTSNISRQRFLIHKIFKG